MGVLALSMDKDKDRYVGKKKISPLLSYVQQLIEYPLLAQATVYGDFFQPS